MNKLRLLAATGAATLLAACTGGQAVSPPVSSAGGGNVASSGYSTLQFAVGTANIAGQSGLNTVVTFRQSNGLSAVGYSTPSITWDGAFTNTSAVQFDGTQTGPNVDDGKPQITGSALPQAGVKPPTSTFGAGNSGLGFSWGAFGYGFNPSNSATNGGPNALQVPCLPVYAATAPGLAAGSPGCNANSGPSFTFADLAADGAMYVGGPPAFPQVRGVALTGQLGAYLGFVPFAGLSPAPSVATPGKSTFTLNLAIPAIGGTQTATTTATMTNFAKLGTFATPTFTPTAGGGGVVNYVLPALVTEAYLMVVNWGPGGGGGANYNYGAGGAPFFYTIRVTGGTSAVLPDNLGATPAIGALPAGRSTKTFCSAADNKAAATAAGTADPGAGDSYQVYAVGFDYPAFGASYPSSNGNPKPAISNAAGQADVTMSDLGAVTPTGF
ncbi:MAG: hypothetical protein NVS2B17_03950 [Candidatus Velthaea sp.]